MQLSQALVATIVLTPTVAIAQQTAVSYTHLTLPTILRV